MLSVAKISDHSGGLLFKDELRFCAIRCQNDIVDGFPVAEVILQFARIVIRR